MTSERMFRIELIYAQKVNWSLINAHIPLVFHLNVDTNAAIDNVSLRISVKARGKEYIRYERTIPQIQPNKPFSVNNLTDRDFIWDFEQAAALSHSISATFKMDLQTEKTIYSVSGPVELLAYNEWHQAVELLEFNGQEQARINHNLKAYKLIANLPPERHISPSPIPIERSWDGDPPLEAGIASLVFPKNKLFQDEAIDSQSQSYLEVLTSNVDVALLDHAEGEPKQRQELIQAVYTMLLKNYPAFHAIEEISLEKESQAVRFPERILPYRGNLFTLERLRSITAKREERKPGATCIDFVLMFCAILERLGLRPLIIIVDNGRHAIAGCWMNNESTFKGRIVCRDKEEIKTLKNANKIFGIDITDYARTRAPYEKAKDQGEYYLDHPGEKGFVYAVDLQETRNTGIKPLPLLPPSNLNPIKWLILAVVTLVMVIGIWRVISPPPSIPPPLLKSLWELLATGEAELAPFTYSEEDKEDGIKCEQAGERIVISYALKKVWVGCAVQFTRFDTSAYKTLIINAEEIPEDGFPKGFAIEFKSSSKATNPWPYLPFQLGQDVTIPIPDIGRMKEITIVFRESEIGAGKGTIYINKFDFSPEGRNERKE